MTDLEICKSIAEIEGYTVSTDVKPSCGSAYVNMYPDNCYGNYNPLTDDALCFKLMLKYEVSLTYGEYAVNAEILIKKEDGEHSFDAQAYCPKLAICLAIIEAHKG